MRPDFGSRTSPRESSSERSRFVLGPPPASSLHDHDDRPPLTVWRSSPTIPGVPNRRGRRPNRPALDAILEVFGIRVDDPSIQNVILKKRAAMKPEDSVSVVVLRGGERVTLAKKFGMLIAR